MLTKNLLFFFTFLLFFSACSQSNKKVEIPKTIHYKVKKVVDELNNPWGMVLLPDKSWLITEKSGVLLHIENGVRNRVQNLPDIVVLGQGGLLDIELHPDYVNNGWLYISYVSPEGGDGGNTALLRAKLENNSLVEKKVLYKGIPNTTSGAHFGSRIEFDDKGFLYFSIGDRYNRDINPQDLTKDGGKIYRLLDDGGIPTDNPLSMKRLQKKPFLVMVIEIPKEWQSIQKQD